MNRPIGTCSCCGGPVVIPDPWWGVDPPTPECSRCHAVPVAPFGAVIPMRPRRAVSVDYVRRESRSVELPESGTFRLNGGGRWSNGGYVCS
jgi:hypothetical protein